MFTFQKPENKITQIAKKVTFQWSHIFNSLTDYVSVHDLNYRIIIANKALGDALCSDPEDLVGKHCYEVIYGMSEPIRTCPHAAVLKNKKATSEIVYNHLIGKPLQVYCYPLCVPSGMLAGTIHIQRNISEQMTTERLLKNLVFKLRHALMESRHGKTLPICISCKRIKTNQGVWKSVKTFFETHTDVNITHGICPDCRVRERY